MLESTIAIGMGRKELKLPLEAIPVLSSSRAESGVDEFPPHEAFVVVIVVVVAVVVGMLP